jgi:hypothetical protein
MKWISTLITLMLVCWSGAAWAAAAQLTITNRNIMEYPGHVAQQAMFCLGSGGAVTSPQTPGAPGAGEACEAGDWSKPLDARRYTQAKLTAFTLTGTATMKLWNCQDSVPGGSVVEHLAGTAPGPPASVSIPEPLCVDLTAGASVTVDGASGGVQEFNITDALFGYLVAEVDACLGAASEANQCDVIVLIEARGDVSIAP